MKHYFIEAFGLIIRLPFKSEFNRVPKQEPDVIVEFGGVNKQLANPLKKGVLYEVGEQEMILRIKNIARFKVNKGNQIIISPEHEASIKDIRVFLFGTVFGYLLQQRGFLTLHANAIADHSHGYLIAGNSGVGKSTLSHSLLQHDFSFMVDDISAVQLDRDNRPVVFPGIQRLKLWKDVLVKMDAYTNDLKPVREGLEKFVVQTTKPIADPRIIKKMIVLTTHNHSGFKISRLVGNEKFNIIKANTYRYGLIVGKTALSNHFRLSTVFAQQVDVFRVVRPNGGFEIDELKNKVLELIYS